MSSPQSRRTVAFKVDVTGRSTRIPASRRDRKASRPPADEPWVWLTRELLSSEAWQTLSINERRVIDRLLIEHMNHAGTMNGRFAMIGDDVGAAGVFSALLARLPAFLRDRLWLMMGLGRVGKPIIYVEPIGRG